MHATFRCTNTAGSSDLELNKEYTNAEVTDLLVKLLSPYIAPTDLKLTKSDSSNFLYGTTNSVYPIMTVTKGSLPLTIYTINNKTAIIASGSKVDASVGETAKFVGDTSSLTTTYSWSCKVSDGSTTLEAGPVKALFYWPYYVGTSESHPSNLTSDVLETKLLTTSTSATYSATVGSTNEYFWIALPEAVVESVSCIGGPNKNSLTMPYDMTNCKTVEVTLNGSAVNYCI